MTNFSKFGSILATVFLLSACGGGSSGGSVSGTNSGPEFDGNTSPAAISSDNAEEIGVAASEGISSSANSDSLPPIAVSIQPGADLIALSKKIRANPPLASLPSAATLDFSEEFCETGSASATFPDNQTSGAVDFTYSFNNCASEGMTMSGTAYVHFDDLQNPNAGFSIQYVNFTMSYEGETVTLNMTIECSDSVTCTYLSDFESSDGEVHRYSDISFTGDETSGIDGTATFYHSTYGRVTVTVTNLTFGECTPYPDGGSISFVSGGTSGDITFSSDCSYTGTWNTGSASGSFSGGLF
jgi:hypothetical protein